jgi:hypothetical protein
VKAKTKKRYVRSVSERIADMEERLQAVRTKAAAKIMVLEAAINGLRVKHAAKLALAEYESQDVGDLEAKLADAQQTTRFVRQALRAKRGRNA